jgi:hypothetical protein
MEEKTLFAHKLLRDRGFYQHVLRQKSLLTAPEEKDHMQRTLSKVFGGNALARRAQAEAVRMTGDPSDTRGFGAPEQGADQQGLAGGAQASRDPSSMSRSSGSGGEIPRTGQAAGVQPRSDRTSTPRSGAPS